MTASYNSIISIGAGIYSWLYICNVREMGEEINKRKGKNETQHNKRIYIQALSFL